MNIDCDCFPVYHSLVDVHLLPVVCCPGCVLLLVDSCCNCVHAFRQLVLGFNHAVLFIGVLLGDVGTCPLVQACNYLVIIRRCLLGLKSCFLGSAFVFVSFVEFWCGIFCGKPTKTSSLSYMLHLLTCYALHN